MTQTKRKKRVEQHSKTVIAKALKAYGIKPTGKQIDSIRLRLFKEAEERLAKVTA